MAVDIRTCAPEEIAAFMRPISVAFGNEPSDDDGVRRFAELFDEGRMHSAVEDGAIVGSAGAFTYELTTPGGRVPAAGVTVVGVLPTHRRRGILTQLMREQIDDIRGRGEAVAILWATEERIYGRFGYGFASHQLATEIEPRHVSFRNDHLLPVRARLVDEEEAYRLIPPIYDAVRAETPGMVSRSETWWRNRRLFDRSGPPPGRSSLFRAVLEHEGEPVAYALYRVTFDFGEFGAELDVNEAMGTSPAATREIWRYLYSIDLVKKVRAARLPVDHPLLLMLDQPRRLNMKLGDALWCRLVDVDAALAARAYADGGSVVLEVTDAFCEWNEGRWRIKGGRGVRTEDAADLALDVSALGSVYLGGFTFGELLRAGQVEELSEGASRRADALFTTGNRSPWCPEIF